MASARQSYRKWRKQQHKRGRAKKASLKIGEVLAVRKNWQAFETGFALILRFLLTDLLLIQTKLASVRPGPILHSHAMKQQQPKKTKTIQWMRYYRRYDK